MSFGLTVFYLYFLKNLSRFPRFFAVAQKFRYVLMRGPLQSIFVGYFRRHSKTAGIAVRGESLFAPLDIEKAVAAIDTESHSTCLRLPPETLSEILAFWQSEQSDNIFHPHKKCRAVLDLARDPQIVAVARGYLRAEPIFYGSRLYYTKPRVSESGELNPRYINAKVVHCDVTDFLDVAVFFYLHDVDLDASPHVLIAGTHQNKTLKDLIAGRYTEAEAKNRFGDNFTTLTGEAGFGFFEDTSVFHIQTCGKKGRAALSLCYTLQRKPEMARHQEVF